MSLSIVGVLNKDNNPHWPPVLGSLIVTQKGINNKIYLGRVYKNISEGNITLIILLNDTEYIDDQINVSDLLPDDASHKGFLVLYPDQAWSYVNPEKLDNALKQKNGSIKNNIYEKYKTLMDVPLTQLDLVHEKVYNEKPLEKACGLDDDFKDTSLLNERGGLQLNELFKEKEINETMFNIKEKFVAPPIKIQEILKKKLNSPDTVPLEEMRIIVNKTIAIKNMIDTKEDEINEGKKIISWLMENMVDVTTDGTKIFGDLKMSIFNGYVHIARKGIKTEDVITEKGLPNLKYFTWQYDIPIDYDTLKYILFQNKLQQNLQRDIEEQQEAEKILSQEYLITLQPEPKYQIWCLKRLLLCWYADLDLQNNIRKIKILINQWRARSDVKFNQKYGVQPSIVVYPKYGKKSARTVLKKISQYFLLYQNVGWACSKPSYFVKLNDLMWYTNGSIDLKLYFRKMKKGYKGNVSTESFDERYTRVKGAERLLYPYDRKEEKEEDDN